MVDFIRIRSGNKIRKYRLVNTYHSFEKAIVEAKKFKKVLKKRYYIWIKEGNPLFPINEYKVYIEM